MEALGGGDHMVRQEAWNSGAGPDPWPPHEYKVSVFCVREALDHPFIELDPTFLFYFENEPFPLTQAALEFMIFLLSGSSDDSCVESCLV